MLHIPFHHIKVRCSVKYFFFSFFLLFFEKRKNKIFFTRRKYENRDSIDVVNQQMEEGNKTNVKYEFFMGIKPLNSTDIEFKYR